MQHAGFVRYFESALRQLSARGHRIVISVQTDRDKLDEQAAADEILRRSGTFEVEHLPEETRHTALASVAVTVRSMRDALRYQRPEYRRAPLLRMRAERLLPGPIRTLVRMCASAGAIRMFADRLCRLVDRAIPPAPSVMAWCASAAPDMVIASPAINFGSSQPEYFKAAQRQGIPTVAAIPSWDNLTTKGTLAWVPDRLLVWNGAMREEAVTFHQVPEYRVAVTGASVFDAWFDWTPSRTREEFCRQAGLPPAAPYVLYLGSSLFLAPAEVEFVERWVAALRSSADPRIAQLPVLIRPHPSNVRPWNSADLEQFGRLSVWPRMMAHPGTERFRRDFFDSLYHCAAVVGMNTSAQIEAAIVGKPVLSVRVEGFEQSQVQTLHFDHLASGLVLAADSLEEHIAQLRGVLDDPAPAMARSAAFVREFVKPPAPYRSAAEAMVAAVEGAAATRPQRIPDVAWARVVRAALVLPGWILGAAFRAQDQRAWVIALRLVFRCAVAVASVMVGILDAVNRSPAAARSLAQRARRWAHSTRQDTRAGAVKLSKRTGRALRTLAAEGERSLDRIRRRQRRRLDAIGHESARVARRVLHRQRKRVARLRHTLRRALTRA